MALSHADILTKIANPQVDSPLFKTLPGEIRHQIYCLALTDYPDPAPEKRYANTTCYARPSYFAPRKSDVSLLHTCRAVYSECWFLPFLLREQTHWLTSPNRAPPEYDIRSTREELEAELSQIRELVGRDQDLVIDGLRVFAQMWAVEQNQLAHLLATPNLNPRRLILTIRHTDWWFWENEEPLRFEGGWIERVCQHLPESVREICIELESLEKRRGQVDIIAQQMREKWFFKTKRGIALFADASGRSSCVSRWSGSSTWHNFRWERDETEEGRVDYYILAITFLPEHVLKRNGGTVSDQAKNAADNDIYDAKNLKLCQPREHGQIRGLIESESSDDDADEEDEEEEENEGSEIDDDESE